MTELTTISYGTIDYEYAARLAGTPAEEDGPVWMVNLMKYRERAAYEDGDRGLSGREADDRYTPLGPLAAVGAEIVFVADVEDQLLGPDPAWDRVAVVRYPTRRSFIDMQEREDFRKKHVHKEAGMEQTIVIGCVPFDLPPSLTAKEVVDWSEVPHPPTAEDGPVMVIHVIRFEDDEAATNAATPEEMDAYSSEAANVAVPHGVRIAGWFNVDGTIIGDGRSWHQVRFNAFPSREAFMAVVFDPDRLEAQRKHREVAIADTYTLVLRASIDELAESTSR